MEGLSEPAQLFACDWKELRTEVSPWDDDPDESIEGFDGYTRFWCRHAVFDIYWVAEVEARELTLFLTSDLMLTGFRESLPFSLTAQELVDLARHVGWSTAARSALKAGQLNLFE